MADSLGYEIIREAVPKTLAQKAAETLLKQPKYSREKYDAFEIPLVCSEVKKEFVSKTDQTALRKFLHPKPIPPEPDHMFAGVFRETEADPTRLKTAEKGEIYATIALTRLSPENGWYTFYVGTRANQSKPNSSSSTAALSLDVGDAVVWRGDLIYFHAPGGGGMFQTIVYKR
ncbi:hypothetical protein ACMYSQ_012298 [Aspergillus niger]